MIWKSPLHSEGTPPVRRGQNARGECQAGPPLLASIRTEDVYGLRDRAVLGTLIYTGARVGAISRLRIQDLRDHGNHRALQFSEKGGKSREIPVRHDLDEWIVAYLEGAALAEAPKASALFRSGKRRGSPLTDRAMSPLAVQLMLKRRLKAAGLAGDPLAPLVPGPGGHGPALPERAARGRPVPGRPRPPPHHPDLRPAPPARQPEFGGADLGLRGFF